MASYLSLDDCWLYAVSPDRERRYPIRNLGPGDLSASKEEHDIGVLTITLSANDPIIARMAADADGFDPYDDYWQWSFDLYIRDTSEPAWSGPIQDRTVGVSNGVARFTFVCETFWHHFSRRGVFESNTNAVITQSTIAVENAIRAAHRSFLGSGTTTPPHSHPGSRGTMPSGWTVTGEANDGTPGTDTILLTDQAGTQIDQYVLAIAEKELTNGVYMYAFEDSAATWRLLVAYPYQVNDLSTGSGRVLLSARYGTSGDFAATESFRELANLIHMTGTGSGASQTGAWYTNSSSRTAYGDFEMRATKPGNSTATHLADEGDTFATIYGSPRETVQLAALDGNGAVYGSDYAMRDLIAWHDPTAGIIGTALVKGWTLTSRAGGFSLVPTLADIRITAMRQMVDFVGLIGSGFSGSRFRQRDA